MASSSSPSSLDSLLTEQDVAERLATTARHVKKLRLEGKLAYVRIGNLVRFEAAEVERYIASRRQAS
jgi:excisionase family DNA binding protein